MSGSKLVRTEDQHERSCYELALYKSMMSSDSESAAPRSTYANIPNLPPHLPEPFLDSDRDDTTLLQLIPRPSMDDPHEIIEAPPYSAPRSPGWASAPPSPIPVFQPRLERRAKKHSTTRLVAAAQYVPCETSDSVVRPLQKARPTSPLPAPQAGKIPRTFEAG